MFPRWTTHQLPRSHIYAYPHRNNKKKHTPHGRRVHYAEFIELTHHDGSKRIRVAGTQKMYGDLAHLRRGVSRRAVKNWKI